MKTNVHWLVAALTIGCAAPVAAQVPSTVQLPSYSTYGVSTSVSVPDRGRAYLGGIGGARSGSTAFGPALGPGSRGYGRQTGAGNVDVRVTVHDFDAMDKQLLGQAPAAGNKAARRSFGSARAGLSSAAKAPRGSLAEARRQHAADVEAEQQKALSYVRQAKRAAARGKPKVAKVLLQMAERRASAELKAQIRQELAALKDSVAAGKLTFGKPQTAQ